MLILYTPENSHGTPQKMIQLKSGRKSYEANRHDFWVQNVSFQGYTLFESFSQLGQWEIG